MSSFRRSETRLPLPHSAPRSAGSSYDSFRWCSCFPPPFLWQSIAKVCDNTLQFVPFCCIFIRLFLTSVCWATQFTSLRSWCGCEGRSSDSRFPGFAYPCSRAAQCGPSAAPRDWWFTVGGLRFGFGIAEFQLPLPTHPTPCAAQFPPLFSDSVPSSEPRSPSVGGVWFRGSNLRGRDCWAGRTECNGSSSFCATACWAGERASHSRWRKCWVSANWRSFALLIRICDRL